MLVRRGSLSSRRRLPLRGELPLLALPRGDRLRVQAVRRIEREKLEIIDGSDRSSSSVTST
jgi:hypothetical protein